GAARASSCLLPLPLFDHADDRVQGSVGPLFFPSPLPLATRAHAWPKRPEERRHLNTPRDGQSPDPEYDSKLPQHEFDSEFCATKKYQKLSCVHGHTPARRVCMEGFDIGKWFPSCSLEACAFVNWLDEERHGRARSVITKLAEDNIKMKKKLTDLDYAISMMKQERINHMQHMKARDKKELACVVVVFALAIFCVLFAMMIRFFCYYWLHQ
ncbi:hypothetical protein ZWY2020_058285, partial [Hordeum vulgare]